MARCLAPGHGPKGYARPRRRCAYQASVRLLPRGRAMRLRLPMRIFAVMAFG